MQPTKSCAYEAHLDKLLYRAMNQLERLQRQRRGEAVPPSFNINLGRGDTFLRNKAKKPFVFNGCFENWVLVATANVEGDWFFGSGHIASGRNAAMQRAGVPAVTVTNCKC